MRVQEGLCVFRCLMFSSSSPDAGIRWTFVAHEQCVRANCGTDHQTVAIEGHLQYKEKTQSERSYETRKAEHKQTEKHQPRGECRKWTMPSPNHRKIMTSLAGIVSNRLCTILLKHLSANMRRNIKTGSTQTTRSGFTQKINFKIP